MQALFHQCSFWVEKDYELLGEIVKYDIMKNGSNHSFFKKNLGNLMNGDNDNIKQHLVEKIIEGHFERLERVKGNVESLKAKIFKEKDMKKKLSPNSDEDNNNNNNNNIRGKEDFIIKQEQANKLKNQQLNRTLYEKYLIELEGRMKHSVSFISKLTTPLSDESLLQLLQLLQYGGGANNSHNVIKFTLSLLYHWEEKYGKLKRNH